MLLDFNALLRTVFPLSLIFILISQIIVLSIYYLSTRSSYLLWWIGSSALLVITSIADQTVASNWIRAYVITVVLALAFTFLCIGTAELTSKKNHKLLYLTWLLYLSIQMLFASLPYGVYYYAGAFHSLFIGFLLLLISSTFFNHSRSIPSSSGISLYNTIIFGSAGVIYIARSLGFLYYSLTANNSNLPWLVSQSGFTALFTLALLWSFSSLAVNFLHHHANTIRDKNILQVLYNNLLAGIVLIQQSNDSIIECNEGFCKLFNVQRDEVIGKTSLEVVWNGNREQQQAAVADISKPIQFTRKDGNMFYGRAIYKTITINNQPFNMLIIPDITQRVVIEQTLQEREALLQAVFDNAAVGLALSDHEGNFIQINNAYCRLLGFTKEELLNMNIKDISFPDEYPQNLALRQQLSEGKISHGSLEKRLKTKAGGSVHVWLQVSLLRDQHQQPLYYIGQILDITELKRAQAALELEHSRFSAGPVFIVEWDTAPGLRILNVSANASSILGYSLEELTDKDFDFASLIHPDDLKQVIEEMRYYIDHRINHYEQSYRLRKKSGEYAWFYDVTRLVWDNDGNLKTALGYMYDQTNQKQTEIALAKERARLDNIIEGTRTATWEWNVQSGETTFNERWAEIIGYTLEEISPTSIETFVQFTHPHDLQIAQEILQKHFSGELDHYEAEFRMHHKNGNWVWVLDRGKVIEWTPDGKPLLMIGTHQDITRLKQVEEKLRENEAKYRFLVENINDVVWIFNIKTKKLEFVTPSIEKLLGYSQQEILSIPYTEFITAESYQQLKPLSHKIKTAVEKGCSSELPLIIECEHICKDGTLKWIEATLQVIRNNGDPALLGVSRDVTERKQLLDKILLTQKMADLGILAAGIAHEVNSPLQVITGSSETLIKLIDQGTASHDDLIRRLDRINRNAWRIAEIIRSLLAYSRPSVEETKSENINDIIHDTMLLTEHQISVWHNIQVHLDLKDNLPPLICNRNKIIQVLINLLSNARDAMPNGGEIIIRSDYTEKLQQIKLQVQDSGIGFSSKLKTRIFDPFFTTKPIGKGTGLGLSIVMGIIKAHGGTIEVDSEPKKGTTFTIYLPLRPPPEEQNNGAAIDLELLEGRWGKI